MRSIFKFILLKVLGWKIEGDFPHHLKKFVIAAGPHTSNWDFPLGVSVRSITGLRSNYFAKKSLFKWPFGYFFRATGGYPVNRSKKEKLVETYARIIREADEFRLAIAPEGTRKYVEKLKTGFYHIARLAEIPIVLTGMDYANKTIKIMPPLYTQNLEEDMKRITEFFKSCNGKNPHLGIG